MIDLANAVFILDGPSDSGALRQKMQKDYKCTPDIRHASCNGKDVTPEGYVNAIKGTLLFTLSGPYEHIICILDREKRRVSADNLKIKVKNQIIETLSGMGAAKEQELDDKVHVFVPDIMFENWIVADVQGLKTRKKLIKQDVKQDVYDGKSGSAILKKMMEISYRKKQHAPLLFKVVDFKRASENSPSFKSFYSAISSS